MKKFIFALFLILSLAITATTFANQISLNSSAETQYLHAIKNLRSNLMEQGAASGAVVASPSKDNPNYFYHWIRDAALTMRSYIYLGKTDPVNSDTYLKNWLAFEVHLQSLPDQSGLGETRFNADGTIDTGWWMRPQNDGPALRARTMMLWAFELLKRRQKDYVLANIVNEDGPVKKDLNYTMDHWRDPCFDIWEELKADNFFTRMAQMKALRTGAKLFEQLNDTAYALKLARAADEVFISLKDFWSEKDQLIIPNLNIKEGWMKKTAQVDLSVMLASLYLTDDIGEPYSVMDEKVLSSIKKYHDSFAFYEINKNQDTWMLGRYPEDQYDGVNPSAQGNPWFLANTGYAQTLCRLSKNLKDLGHLKITSVNKAFWSDFIKGELKTDEVINYKDARFAEITKNIEAKSQNYFAEVIKHVGENGAMSEQLSRVNGYMTGARDLSWSYASYISAYNECQTIFTK